MGDVEAEAILSDEAFDPDSSLKPMPGHRSVFSVTRIVVDHVDLDIPSGSVCGFVGPNGAGKTTTIRMLLGLSRPRFARTRMQSGTAHH